MDLLEADLIKWWRRKQYDRVRAEVAIRDGVELERVHVYEDGRKLRVKIKPRQMQLPGVR